MNSIKSVYMFYLDGFKNMRIGKSLWKIIFLKLAVIFLFLNYFIHDRSLNTEYKTEDTKVNFVYNNLIGGK